MQTLTIGKVQKRTRFRSTRYKTSTHFRRIGYNIVGSKLNPRSIAFLVIISSLSIIGLNTLYSRFHDTFNHYFISAEAEVVTQDTDIYAPVIAGSNNNIAKVLPSYSTNSGISTIDRRAYVLDEYFNRNNSPLYGTGQVMVDACEKYGAPSDCLIVAAIARNESNLCKYSYSADMHNCWGYGGGGVYRMTFSSFEESIDRVTRTLMEGYGPQYINDPSLMETTFCGNEPGCTNWGNKIKHFRSEINDLAIELGVGSLL